MSTDGNSVNINCVELTDKISVVKFRIWPCPDTDNTEQGLGLIFHTAPCLWYLPVYNPRSFLNFYVSTAANHEIEDQINLYRDNEQNLKWEKKYDYDFSLVSITFSRNLLFNFDRI